MMMATERRRITLNMTPAELRRVGGDYSIVRTICESTSAFDYQLLPSRPRFPNLIRRLAGRLSRPAKKLGLTGMHQFFLSAPVFQGQSDSDAILSVILFPHQLHGHVRPVVWYTQGFMPRSCYDDWSLPFDEYRTLYRAFLSHATVFVSATAVGLRFVEEAIGPLPCPARVAHIPCFLPPLRDSTEKPVDRKSLLFVGRDWKRKGLSTVLRAFDMLSQDGVRARLTVVTDRSCPLRRDYSHVPGIDWRFNVTDSELRGLFAQALVFVAPTHADTYNLTMVEAMSQGCAVVVSRIENLLEVAPDGVVGKAVAPGDPVELAAVLKCFLSDTDSALAMGAAGVDLYKKRNFADVAMKPLDDAVRLAIRRGAL
jgi:glycosyltransferase involved in cell wall biosynthesis